MSLMKWKTDHRKNTTQTIATKARRTKLHKILRSTSYKAPPKLLQLGDINLDIYYIWLSWDKLEMQIRSKIQNPCCENQDKIKLQTCIHHVHRWRLHSHHWGRKTSQKDLHTVLNILISLINIGHTFWGSFYEVYHQNVSKNSSVD